MERKRVVYVLFFILLFLFSGCANLSAVGKVGFLKSNPPFKTIQVKDTLTVKPNTASYSFPAGSYKAVYEDEHGYYYPAPHKICAQTTSGSFLLDGGLYAKRGASFLTSIYVLQAGDPYIYNTEIDQGLIGKEN